jgi:hypothetical protein
LAGLSPLLREEPEPQHIVSAAILAPRMGTGPASSWWTSTSGPALRSAPSRSPHIPLYECALVRRHDPERRDSAYAWISLPSGISWKEEWNSCSGRAPPSLPHRPHSGRSRARRGPVDIVVNGTEVAAVQTSPASCGSWRRR